MIKVSTTGMVVSLKTDLRFPIPGQQGHGGRIIQLAREMRTKLLHYSKHLKYSRLAVWYHFSNERTDNNEIDTRRI